MVKIMWMLSGDHTSKIQKLASVLQLHHRNGWALCTYANANAVACNIVSVTFMYTETKMRTKTLEIC